MSNASLRIVVLALIACAASSGSLAQSSKSTGPDLRPLGDRTIAPARKPNGRASGMKACPEYGAGFYRLAGTDTCVRIGGGVASDVGVAVRGH